MTSGAKKHLFNTIFFAILAMPSLYWAINGSLKVLNRIKEPVTDGAMQISVNPALAIFVIFIKAILPLILTIVLIFHVVAFLKCNLENKKFNTEFFINLILAVGGLASLVFVWYLNQYGSPEGGMILIFPSLAGIVALIISIVTFFIGYAGNRQKTNYSQSQI